MLDIKTKVKEFSGCSADAISPEVVESSVPLVLRGLVDEWPLTQIGKTSSEKAADYLRKFYKGMPVVVSVGEPETQGRVFYKDDFSQFNFQSCKVNLNDLLDKILQHQQDPAPPTLYMGSTVIDNWLPGFREENDLALNKFGPRVGIWIGNKNRIAAHWDLPDNIACTVVGKRRVTLFPPDQLENLYPGPIEWAPGGQSISLVDFYAPDYEKFPKFREALKYAQVVELEPGDAVFIPSMWWHHVESLSELNVLVNYWWRRVPRYLGTPMNVLHHALLTLRELPEEQRNIWKNVFDYYIFNADENTHAHIPKEALGLLSELDDDLARKLRAMLLEKLNR